MADDTAPLDLDAYPTEELLRFGAENLGDAIAMGHIHHRDLTGWARDVAAHRYALDTILSVFLDPLRAEVERARQRERDFDARLAADGFVALTKMELDQLHAHAAEERQLTARLTAEVAKLSAQLAEARVAGPCMDLCPSLFGSSPAISCTLRARHTGGHTDGTASWTQSPGTTLVAREPGGGDVPCTCGHEFSPTGMFHLAGCARVRAAVGEVNDAG